jgi:hypothetical protein
VQQNGTALRSSTGALQFGSGEFQPVFETPDYSKEDRISTFNEINIRLGCFANLADASLSQWKRWRRVYRIVRPYGRRALGGLLFYIARYNAAQSKNRVLTFRRGIRTAGLHEKK